MSDLSLALALLLPVGADATTHVQKPRTLNQIIELADRSGKPSQVSAALAEELGLGTSPIPMRQLRYKQSTTPDKKDHTFGVLYRIDEGKEVPFSILLTVGVLWKEGGKLMVDGMVYLATLSGELKEVRRNFGIVGRVEVERFEVNADRRRQFRSELRFFTNVAPILGLEIAK